MESMEKTYRPSASFNKMALFSNSKKELSATSEYDVLKVALVKPSLRAKHAR